MKILIAGAGGQLSWELEQTAPENAVLVSLSESELDIADSDKVKNVISSHRPDLIINAAAYTAVDKAESDPDLAFLVNAKGAENLAIAAREHNCRFVHVSTDFIFDGTKTTPYFTDDTPNPLSVYGSSKLEGEQLVVATKPDSIVVRTAWVYSTHGNNFVKTMLRLMAEKPELGIIYDQVGSPTYARNLAKWIWSIIDKPDVSGIFHWTDAGVASWYDFAVAIQEIGLELGLLNKEIPINPISTAAYPTPAKRPAFSVIDKSGAESAVGYRTTYWRKALKEMMVNLKS